MQKMVIGITGGIASGKTQVSNTMYASGYQVVDADMVAREVVAVDTAGWQQVVDQFGAGILTDSGEINRRKLRHKVFQDDSLRKKLNAITHPLIQKEIQKRVQAFTTGLLVLVIPLLDERSRYAFIDRVLVVDVLPDIQLMRIQSRDNETKTSAECIVASQISRQQRMKLADDVISNNQSLERLESQSSLMLTFYRSLIN